MIFERLKEALYFWRRHLAALFLISAPYALLGEAAQWVMGPFLMFDGDQLTGINLSVGLVMLLIRPLAEGALIMQLASIHQGRAQGVIACTLPALMLYPALVLTYFLIGIGVTLGWTLLFFPALWVYTRLCFAPFRVVLHRQSPIAALRGAFQYSGPCQWPLLGAILLTGLIMFGLIGLTNTLFVGLLGESAGVGLVINVLASLITTLINVVVFRFWLLNDPGTQQT